MRNITSMDDTQNIFKDTIAEFMDWIGYNKLDRFYKVM
jgi:hypothetical protein